MNSLIDGLSYKDNEERIICIYVCAFDSIRIYVIGGVYSVDNADFSKFSWIFYFE